MMLYILICFLLLILIGTSSVIILCLSCCLFYYLDVHGGPNSPTGTSVSGGGQNSPTGTEGSAEQHFPNSSILTAETDTLLKNWVTTRINPKTGAPLTDYGTPWKLCYSSTEHGKDDPGEWHTRCDGYNQTVIVGRNQLGYTFGGYTGSPWGVDSFGRVPEFDGIWTTENTGQFLFRLDGPEGDNPDISGPEQFDITNENTFYQYSQSTFWPAFGSVTWGYDLIFGKEGTLGENFAACSPGSTYQNENLESESPDDICGGGMKAVTGPQGGEARTAINKGYWGDTEMEIWYADTPQPRINYIEEEEEEEELIPECVCAPISYTISVCPDDLAEFTGNPSACTSTTGCAYTAPTCTGTATDSSTYSNCDTAFNASGTLRGSGCPPGCVYTVETCSPATPTSTVVVSHSGCDNNPLFPLQDHFLLGHFDRSGNWVEDGVQRNWCDTHNDECIGVSGFGGTEYCSEAGQIEVGGGWDDCLTEINACISSPDCIAADFRRSRGLGNAECVANSECMAMFQCMDTVEAAIAEAAAAAEAEAIAAQVGTPSAQAARATAVARDAEHWGLPQDATIYDIENHRKANLEHALQNAECFFTQNEVCTPIAPNTYDNAFCASQIVPPGSSISLSNSDYCELGKPCIYIPAIPETPCTNDDETCIFRFLEAGGPYCVDSTR